MRGGRIAALEKEAAGHKRAVSFHRKRLRECMKELAKLRALAARMGMSFTTGEEETHGQATARSKQLT